MDIEFFRNQGKVPDLFYYQMNGKSALENYIEQRDNFYNSLQDSEEPETVQFIFTSEVK
jgi:hypothetical protein